MDYGKLEGEQLHQFLIHGIYTDSRHANKS